MDFKGGFALGAIIVVAFWIVVFGIVALAVAFLIAGPLGVLGLILAAVLVGWLLIRALASTPTGRKAMEAKLRELRAARDAAAFDDLLQEA